MTRAFRLAARHSRRVRKLRLAIPVTIVFILGATILVSWLDPLKVLVRLPLLAHLVVDSALLLDLLSRQSSSAAMARSSPPTGKPT